MIIVFFDDLWPRQAEYTPDTPDTSCVCGAAVTQALGWLGFNLSLDNIINKTLMDWNCFLDLNVINCFSLRLVQEM